MAGTISLIYKGEAVRVYQFNDKPHQERIKDLWRKLYGKKFMECTVKTDEIHTGKSPFTKGFMPDVKRGYYIKSDRKINKGKRPVK